MIKSDLFIGCSCRPISVWRGWSIWGKTPNGMEVWGHGALNGPVRLIASDWPVRFGTLTYRSNITSATPWDIPEVSLS